MKMKKKMEFSCCIQVLFFFVISTLLVASLYVPTGVISVTEMPKFVMYEEQDVDMTLAQRDQALASTNQIKFTKEYFKRNYGFKDDEIEIASAIQPISPFSENGSEIQKSPYDISQFDELTQAVLKPVLEMIEHGISYNEIQDRIVEMFPDLETNELEDFLAKGILIATGSGFLSVRS